jgi:hypothetical protein
MSSSARAAPSRPHLFAFAGVCLAMLTAPLIWHVARVGWAAQESAPPSYLPALELARERAPFRREPIDDLRTMRPGYVIVGDSMAGRLDVARLTSLTRQNVAPILQNATGSAHWYLVLKNYVVASGIRPKWVLVFFRDTNLTDPLFRLGGEYRGVLDQVALDREDELNAVISARTQGGWFRAHTLTTDRWSRVHTLIDRMYGVERSRVWVEPAMTAWLARVAVGRQRRRAFLADVNTMFELDRLRPLASADIGAPEDRDLDFRSNVTSSTLPLFLQLAKQHGLNLCFVRVLRRPQNGRPPDEPAALTQYVRDLREYIEARDAVFMDDRDDPEMARIAYADGDHIARAETGHYTELFLARLARFAR